MGRLWDNPSLVFGLAVLLCWTAEATAQSPSDSWTPANDQQSVNFATDDGEKPWTLNAFYGYETFKGVADGGWQNNGLLTGINFGTRMGRISDITGIGFQLGGSIGIYNWSGTDWRVHDNNEAEMQGFTTMGFFRKSSEECPWSGAVVFDWMLNDNFGGFSQTPTLNQWRYRLGYDFNERDSFGVWGALHGESSTRLLQNGTPVTYEGISQASFFWHRHWELDSDTYVWVGVPQADRLSGGGTLGVFIAGASATIPLSQWMGLYTNVTYMRPSAHAGPLASDEDEWSFAIGLTIYPRRDSRTSTVANRGWAPLMPVASNATFFVDTSRPY